MKNDKNSQYYRKSPPKAESDKLAGSEHLVTIEKVVPGGMGLCRINGQVIFIPGSLPGEEIRIELGAAQGGFRSARIREIILSSPKRLVPSCVHYGHCGGCDFQYADPAYQVELKLAILIDTLRRQGGLDAVAEGLTIGTFAGDAWSYRNRMQFHPVPNGGEESAKLGLMARDSVQVVPLLDCPVAAVEIRAWLGTNPPFVASPLQNGVAEIADDNELGDGGARMKVFGADGRISTGNLGVSIAMSDRALEFSTAGFFQSNVAMLKQLLGWLTDRLPSGDQAWDLYCGCGVFAALLEKRFAQVFAVDNQAINIDFARRNTDPARTTVFHAGVDEWLTGGERRAPDLVMLDPPRAGLSRQLMQWLTTAKPAHIGYVSCNPVTFSRDLKLLRTAGYQVGELALFDFYPQTWHVETACLLSLG